MDSVNNTNEITVKSLVNLEEFTKDIKSKGFNETDRFSLDDDYYIPKNINVNEMSPREILSKAILVRTRIDANKTKHFFSFKEKNIDENGNIISQKSTSCDIVDKEDAMEFVKSIGYKFLMNIKENDVVYENGEINIATKEIVGGDILAEIETGRGKIHSIEELETSIKKINLPIVKGEYFYKKAEIELEKILSKNNKRL